MDIRKKTLDFLTRFKKEIGILFIPIIFLVVGILTLDDYGVNWDEPFHYMRGQAYLHYYLSGGEKNYDSLPEYPKINLDCSDGKNVQLCNFSPGGPNDREQFTGDNKLYEERITEMYPQDSKIWRSYFQHDTYTYEEIIKIENGHPAVGDIIAALFNYVFYQKLHIFGDIESYHFFEVFTSFLVVAGVAVIVYLEYGFFASIVSSASLALYPLFLGESHFNIKDPPETAFFGLTIILFYIGITRNKWKYIITSAIFASLALGTKFNAFFIAPIVGLWFLYYIFTANWYKRNNTKLIISLCFYPIIVAGLFYALWPYLWTNPIENFMGIFRFYKQIGMGTPGEMSKYIYFGWNMYPAVWIFLTTPLTILFLSIIGLFYSIYLFLFKKSNFAFLICVWFLLPIFRASYPNVSIYGGVRQLMEYVPAMAILAGIGVTYLTTKFKFIKLIYALISLGLAFTAWEMINIHPNQNVYFNQIIGGLSGAKEKNIPYWGNSYGNAYQQGLSWLNENAEPNAKVGLPISTMGNIPWLKFRSDLEFSNSSWSGPNRLGEYEIELDFDWGPKSWYSYAYYDVYLNPVYEAKVDGVPILKVWKNDIYHTKKGYEKETKYAPKKVKIDKTSLFIDMGREIQLTRLTIGHGNRGCVPQKGGYISLSKDNKNWVREVEAIDYPQVPPAAVNITDTNFVYLFAAKKARYVLLETALNNSCLFKNYNIEVRGLSL